MTLYIALYTTCSWRVFHRFSSACVVCAADSIHILQESYINFRECFFFVAFILPYRRFVSFTFLTWHFNSHLFPRMGPRYHRIVQCKHNLR